MYESTFGINCVVFVSNFFHGFFFVAGRKIEQYSLFVINNNLYLAEGCRQQNITLSAYAHLNIFRIIEFYQRIYLTYY